MKNFIELLGNTIENRITEMNDFDREFTDVAFSTLSKLQLPLENIDASFVNYILEQDLPRSTHISTYNKFGEPPITIYNSDKFYIELLFWFPSRTSIHGHGFTGAFKVLRGSSIQVHYEFYCSKQYSTQLKTGTLKPHSIDLLQSDSTHKISPDDKFIHAVVHIGKPSLTLVVRTKNKSSATQIPQYCYYRSGLAFDPFYKKKKITRQLDAIFTLYRSGDSLFTEALTNYLAASEIKTIYALFYIKEQIYINDDAYEHLFDVITARMSTSLVDCLKVTMDEHSRTHSIWSNIHLIEDHSLYLEIALKELFSDKDALNTLLRKHRPDSSPEMLLSEWNQSIASNM